jgi:hypothetical protein
MYFAYASYRTLQTAADQTVADFVDLEWPEEDDDNYGYSGIIVIPPADTDYTVMAGGNFLPVTLSGDTDTNFWSDEYPGLLVMAALRSLAMLDGNSAMVRHWEYEIHAEIVQIGFFNLEDLSQEDQVEDLSDRLL